MNKNMKKIILFLLILIVVGGGAFYGGMKYQQSKTPSRQAFQNLTPEQRQQFLQQGAGERAGAGFLSGEVIAKDEKSLTLKMSNGGSKIVFFSDSTQISKTTEGTKNDIEIGKQIMVSGSQNPDGSYTAKTIQLSPHSLAPRNSE